MDFIHRIPNLVSQEFCKDLIELFEKSNLKEKGASYVVNNGVVEKEKENTTKVSTDISIHPNFVKEAEESGEPEWFEYIQYINSKLEKGLDSYMLEHSELDNIQNFVLEG